MNTTHEVVVAQLWLELEQAKQDNLALQTLHDEREDRINTLVMKQCQKLNRKMDKTLVAGWKQWSAQATELQVLRANTENRRKEDRGFYKMDGTSISMIREDLEEDFHALADGHTKAISLLLEEFNDEMDGYKHERLQAERDAMVSTQATVEILSKRATQELHNEELVTEERGGQDREE